MMTIRKCEWRDCQNSEILFGLSPPLKYYCQTHIEQAMNQMMNLQLMSIKNTIHRRLGV